LEKAHEIAKGIEVPTEVHMKESTIEASQLGIELIENLQRLVVSGELVDTTEGVQKEAGCSEANASEAEKGNTDSLNIANIIEIESSTTLDSHSTSTSHTTSTSTSSDIDDIPLNRVYANIQKRLFPSSSTKHKKNPDNDTFVPMLLCKTTC